MLPTKFGSISEDGGTMRSVREGFSAAALAIAWAVSGWARWHDLPTRIPTHFRLSGQADDWGSANQIFLMPAIALGLYLLLTVVVRFPQGFHYGVAVTEENRARLEATALALIGWLKAELMGLMAVLVALQVRAAERGSAGGIGIAVLLGMGAILGTVLVFKSALRRTGSRRRTAN